MANTTIPMKGPVEPSAPDTWVVAQKGDASGSIVENSASSLTINASGSSDTTVDIDYAYQSISSGDIQVVAVIPATWSGHSENFTQFGVGITEGDTADDWFMNCFWPAVTVARIKHGVANSITEQTGASGQSLPRYVALTYDDTAGEVRGWESSDGVDWFQIGDTVSRSLSYADLRAYVYGCSHDSAQTSTATLTDCSVTQTITIEESEEQGARNVLFTADFESGQVNAKEDTTDGFFIHTLPIDQTGSESLSSGSGGFGPEVEADTRVITGRTPPSTGLGSATECNVSPRVGTYFLESTLHFEKDYTELNGGLHKPRSKITISGHPFDFDVEGWIGFSIYLPSNLEIESSPRRYILYSMNTNASATLLTLELSAPELNASSWALNYNTSDDSVTEGGSDRTWVNLGDISDDRGKWTDFVIHYRWNPFASGQGYSCPVNPVQDLGISGAKDQDYPCDKGILQLWKATGEVDGNGDRTMTNFINVVDSPVGLVPRDSLQIKHAFKIYKGAWQTASTSIDGPIWNGFDAIHFGYTIANGTDYSDVHPTRKSQP